MRIQGRCSRSITCWGDSLGDEAHDTDGQADALEDPRSRVPAGLTGPAVRRARHHGVSWAEIGTLFAVTRKPTHRKFRKVG